jgi:DNA-binding MarR family transcriptional regulator
MKIRKVENIVGALALALSDSVLLGAQEQAPEPGPAAAALTLLVHEPGMPIERLRRALRLSHPGAVRLVDRLVAENLIERRPSPTDRRAVALYLTKAGEKSSNAIFAVRQSRIEEALKVLDPSERDMLGKLTEKLLRGLVHDLDQAYSVCRLCDPGVCTNCPVSSALEATS